ncbi:MAG: hypothetical protein PVI06_10145, partial [Desulfobacterales bacterium]
MKRTLQQAAGNLPREEFYLFSDSLANPAASCGECAHFHGSNRPSHNYLTVLLVILIHLLILLPSELWAKEQSSGFVFYPKSDYWPTKGWKISTPEYQGMSSEILVKLFEDIENRNLDIDSLMVVRNGYIVVEANKRHFETLYPIYSSTKSFTSAVIGIALS